MYPQEWAEIPKKSLRLLFSRIFGWQLKTKGLPGILKTSDNQLFSLKFIHFDKSIAWRAAVPKISIYLLNESFSFRVSLTELQFIWIIFDLNQFVLGFLSILN